MPRRKRRKRQEPDRDPDHFYIYAVGEIIDRKPDTIRKWESKGWLPKELLPQRGYRNRRYWTREQIEAIIVWMDENDMRPGKNMIGPERESEDLKTKRKPKYIDGHHMMVAKKWAARGKSARFIALKVHRMHMRREGIEEGDVGITGLGYPRLDNWYSTLWNVEQALRTAFEIEGLDFPEVPRFASLRARRAFVPPVSIEQARKQKEKHGRETESAEANEKAS